MYNVYKTGLVFVAYRIFITKYKCANKSYIKCLVKFCLFHILRYNIYPILFKQLQEAVIELDTYTYFICM